MYDAFSDDYDRFVNWNNRLAGELPFIKSLLSTVASMDAVRVLDAACGTGMHVIALAQHGYTCAGADLSSAMIARARANAAAAGVDVPFAAVGFGALANEFGGDFDALLCLGNSLPHLLTPAALVAALADFAACLRPGGLLLIQNRNFDSVLASRQRWMEPQAYREPSLHLGGAENEEGGWAGAKEWLFLRFYDFESDDAALGKSQALIQFNMITLRRTGAAPWEQSVTSTRLRPLLHVELVTALQGAGFERVTAYGGLDGSEFDAGSSGNLVLTAYKATY